MALNLPSRIAWILASFQLRNMALAAPRTDAGVRRIGTGLFLHRSSLYKARGQNARRMFSLNLFRRDADSAGTTLLYPGIERNLAMTVTLSVVVPVKDEAENVAQLALEILRAVGTEAEIIFVDDGSQDNTAEVLKALKAEIPSLRAIAHGRNIGQSRAVRTGVRAARGEIVATLDGDGQNDPADIPRLLHALQSAPAAARVGMVAGVRQHRKDDVNKRYASGFANWFRNAMLHDGATDSGCGLKVFRRDAFLALPYFDNMHRFLIALMQREGYVVEYLPVEHRARVHGASKYKNLSRALVGFFDTFGVRWLQHRFKGAVDPREI
jgi:dolichol-phosphate mannosyltransferase